MSEEYRPPVKEKKAKKKSKEDKLREKDLPDTEKLTKEDKKYLNSKARVAKRIVFCILEYIIVFAIMIAIAAYMEYGNLDNFFDEIQNLGKWFEPGGMLFNALVGYLPILILSCIGTYFGEGTVGKMAFGIIKCIAIILWLILVFDGAETSLAVPDVVSSMGLEEFKVKTEGLIKFAVMVMIFSLLIPIGEFAGARKKHKRALAKKERIESSAE